MKNKKIEEISDVSDAEIKLHIYYRLINIAKVEVKCVCNRKGFTENLDKIVIKEDIDKRGRKEGEIAGLLSQSILKRNKEIKPRICLDEVKALEEALNISKRGDIIIVFYEKLRPLLDFINNNKEINNESDLKYGDI